MQGFPNSKSVDAGPSRKVKGDYSPMTGAIIRKDRSAGVRPRGTKVAGGSPYDPIVPGAVGGYFWLYGEAEHAPLWTTSDTLQDSAGLISTTGHSVSV